MLSWKWLVLLSTPHPWSTHTPRETTQHHPQPHVLFYRWAFDLIKCALFRATNNHHRIHPQTHFGWWFSGLDEVLLGTSSVDEMGWSGYVLLVGYFVARWSRKPQMATVHEMLINRQSRSVCQIMAKMMLLESTLCLWVGGEGDRIEGHRLSTVYVVHI